jgi:GntR family transcriptional regulator
MLRTVKADNQPPLHAQLAAELRRAIDAGRWRPGEAIPSERELMRQAGVSRATVRQALGTLINEQRLQRAHGRGTFVAHPRVEQPLQEVYSFAEQLHAAGRSVVDRFIQRRVVPADAPLAARLGLQAGEPLLHLQRVRMLDGAPLTLDNFFVSYRLCPELLDAPLAGSLYRVLAVQFGLPVLRSTDTFEPVAADRATAFFLEVPVGAPLMFVERVGYTSNDLPLHVGRNYVRGDRCRFRVNLGSAPAAVELKPATEPPALETPSFE